MSFPIDPLRPVGPLRPFVEDVQIRLVGTTIDVTAALDVLREVFTVTNLSNLESARKPRTPLRHDQPPCPLLRRNEVNHPGTTSPAQPARTPGEKFETTVLVVILLTVGGFAGFASFSHVHDWTMTNSPAGTGTWFGWANAVVSELVPIAALLVMRRRRRTGQPVAYPATLLILAIGLSVTAQLAVARPSLSGGVVAVVPALAFAALAKLVLGKASLPPAVDVRVTAVQPTIGDGVPATAPIVPTPPVAVLATVTDGGGIGNGVPELLATPEPISSDLLAAARKAAVAMLKETGRPITRDELRAALRIRTETASEILRRIRDAEPPAEAPQRAAQPATVGAQGNGRSVTGLIGTVTR